MRQVHTSSAFMPPTTTYPAILGRVVTEIRKHRGLGQAELAVGLGITQSGLSRIERGDTAPTVEQVSGLAKALGLTPGALLTHADRAVQRAEAQGIRVLMKRSEVQKSDLVVMLGALALGALVVGALAAVLRGK